MSLGVIILYTTRASNVTYIIRVGAGVLSQMALIFLALLKRGSRRRIVVS